MRLYLTLLKVPLLNMTRFMTRCLLHLFMLSLLTSSAPTGLPPFPSSPRCHIPYDEYDGMVHTSLINCVWEPGPDCKTPTNYTLHWESANDKRGHVEATNFSASIHRPDFESHSELIVWIQAINEFGSTYSPIVSFNTAEIMKLPPPIISAYSQDPLSISWNSRCSLQGYSEGECEVQYRSEADQFWHEGEGGFHGEYYIDDPQPYTVYEFQVRCSCADHMSLMSDWSPGKKVESLDGAPVGKLNIWWDCDAFPRISKCALTWKTLPRSQARGLIRRYEIKWIHSNGTELVVDANTAEFGGKVVCDERQCYLTSSPADVSEVYVSAYNNHSSTVPAHLRIPGEGVKKEYTDLKINSTMITLVWDVPFQLMDDLKEYVVQYKQLGLPPAQGFDWVRVKKSQNSTILTGNYENYIPYRVSFFAVLKNDDSYLLSSEIAYVLQGTPAKVPSFNVVNIESIYVNLSWSQTPLHKRRGVILCYQIEVDNQKVYNVSASLQREMNFQLDDLVPDQDYIVGIRALTAVGPGPKTTTEFKTKHQEHNSYIILISISVTILSAVIIFILIISKTNKEASALMQGCYYGKVPDPGNSCAFQHMNHQINDFFWTCVPTHESSPQISNLEFIQVQPDALKKASHLDELTKEELEDDHLHRDREKSGQVGVAASEEESERTEWRHVVGKRDYSIMIDSEEERDEVGKEEMDDDINSSEKDQCFSDYEKHFMPTALDVLKA